MTTKQIVLSRLLASAGFVSGGALARACSLSRTSVWKAVQALQTDGYRIEAVSRRGYRLLAAPDPIDGVRIARTLAALGVTGCAVSAHASLDSTLSESRRQCASAGALRAADGTLTAAGARLHRSLIVTGEQTAGRGRMGRPFSSPAGSGVYFTVIYVPKDGVTTPALLTAAAAVAVARAVDELCGTSARIKWVNDVFLGGKKICGILTEGSANFETGRIEAANVGIGINVHPMGFTGELAAVAGSIDEALAAAEAGDNGSNALATTGGTGDINAPTAAVTATAAPRAMADASGSVGNDALAAAGGTSAPTAAATATAAPRAEADASDALAAASSGTCGTSLPLLAGAVPRVSRNDVVAHAVAHLLALYDAMERGDRAAVSAALAEYRARSLLTGRTVTVNPAAGLGGEPYQARVLGIDDSAALIVRLADGTERALRSGEVSLRSAAIASQPARAL